MRHNFLEVAVGLVILAFAGLAIEHFPVALALCGLALLWFCFAAWKNSDAQKEKRARRRTHALYKAVLKSHGLDPSVDQEEHRLNWVKNIYRALPDVAEPVMDELIHAAAALYDEEEFFEPVSPPPAVCNSLQGAKYRDYLTTYSAKSGNQNAELIAQRLVKESFRDFLDALPAYELHEGDLWGELPLKDTGDLRAAVQALALPFYGRDAHSHLLFERMRAALDRNLCEASGVPYSREMIENGKLVLPEDADPLYLAPRWLKNTPFEDIGEARLPFRVPRDARWEHTMVVAGSGHGKTTMLGSMILGDIERAIDGEGGFAVIDPKGGLIDAVAKLDCFDPEHGALRDKLLIIDPKRDVEFPPAINMFDLKIDDESLNLADRLAVRNNALELIDYLLTDLLDIGMTGRQQVGFNYVGDLLMQIEGATIKTLLQFLESPEDFEEHINKCDETTQNYLRSRFLSASFKAVRDQLADRVYGLLKLPMMEAMFSHPKTKIDLQAAVNEGKIVLIKADEDFLSTTGSKLFGGVWIAMLFQACLARVAIPREDRLGFTLYIDEASNFFSEKLRQLLIKAREYKLGVVFAFQDMEMIESPQLRASALGSTSTKFAGGLNAHDRKVLAAEMNTTDAYLRTPRKYMREMRTEFACYVRGVTEAPLLLSYPIGALDSAGRMSEVAYEEMIEENRLRVSWAEVADSPDEAVEDAAAADEESPEESVSQAESGVSPIEPLHPDEETSPSEPSTEPKPESDSAPKKPKPAGPKGAGPSFDMDFTIDKSVKKPKE